MYALRILWNACEDLENNQILNLRSVQEIHNAASEN